jgi:hypothetical protein
MKSRRGLWIALSAVLLFLTVCKSPTTNTSDQPKSDPSFSSDIQPIFNSSCAVSSCHNATAQAGLNLSSGTAYGAVVNVASSEVPSLMRAAPGDATNSYLVMKLEGRQTSGNRMPAGGNPLSSTQIQNIKNWINQGAKNN